MNDQAQHLRELINVRRDELKASHNMQIITVTSGKGGVGKSNFSTNFALWLKKLGKRPIILDADFGLANIEIILGEKPRYNLSHFINEKCPLSEVITQSRHGIPFISGGSGIKEMSFLSVSEIEHISEKLMELSTIADVLIIDTGAGINEIVMRFCQLADEVYLVVTPEPTSITDSYALLKTLVGQLNIKSTMRLVINKAESQDEAYSVYHKLSYVCNKFLKYTINYTGFIPYDSQVFKAVKEQVPIAIYAPQCKASTAYKQIAYNYIESIQLSKKTVVYKENWVSRFKKLFSTV